MTDITMFVLKGGCHTRMRHIVISFQLKSTKTDGRSLEEGEAEAKRLSLLQERKVAGPGCLWESEILSTYSTKVMAD